MSGGHYPSYNHIQSPQDFIAPRHRLPAVPASGPTVPYGSPSSISNAHTSHTSWMKNRNYGPNYSGNSTFFAQSAPRNYSPVSRAQSKEDSSWSVVHFANSPAVGNPSFRDSNQTDGMEPKNMSSKDDIQQESMDLSASHNSPTDATEKPNQEIKTSVNGDTNGTGQSDDKSKSNVNEAEPDKIKETSSPKLDAVVSVIAPNPLKTLTIHSENSVKRTSKSSLSDVTPVPEAEQAPCDKVNISNTSRINKVPSDNVESALETMFHSEISPVSSSSSSVIMTAQICKTPPTDLRAESVEKILKSPSPAKCDDDNSVEESSYIPKLSRETLEKEAKSQNSLTTENSVKLTKSPSGEVESNDAKKETPLNCCKIEISKATNATATENNNCSDINKAESNEEVKPKAKDEKLSASFSVIAAKNDVNSSDKQNAESELGKLLLARPRTKGECKTFETEVKQETNNTAEATNEECSSKRKSQNEEITYVEVESELEKMFAGIEDGEVNGNEMDPLNNFQVISSAGDRSSQRDGNLFCNSTSAIKSSKKKNSKKLKSNMSKGSKETKMKSSVSAKETSFDNILAKRLPVIHVEGSKENPISTQIINSIKLEDDDVSDGKTGAKRKLHKNDIGVKRSAASYVVKNYDPGTSDASWICVFCQLCAYSPGIDGEATGDLFGPYFIKDPHVEDESKRHSRKENHMEQVKKKKLKKQKRSLSIGNDYFDPSIAEDQKLLEIWAHENCIVWASGVHLIGSKLIGLEEAVIEAMETTCAHCSNTGASIGCKARHCKSCVHYGCALFTGWKLDPDTFVATCNVHQVPDK